MTDEKASGAKRALVVDHAPPLRERLETALARFQGPAPAEQLEIGKRIGRKREIYDACRRFRVDIVTHLATRERRVNMLVHADDRLVENIGSLIDFAAHQHTVKFDEIASLSRELDLVEFLAQV